MSNRGRSLLRACLFLFVILPMASGCPRSEPEAPADDGAAEQEEAHEAVPATRDDPAATPDDPTATPEDVAAPPEDAEVTDSGLASKVLRPGDGDENPEATSMVTVHYTGWTTDGEMFDSSHPRGEPSTFPLDQVIPGWTEGLQLMVVGEKRRFWIPEDLAYAGRPGAPQGMLVFDVELLGIQ